MPKSYLLLIPSLCQSVCMVVDEFHYHLRRGLPRWERIGHPLDTLTVLACLFWMLLVPPDSGSIAVYAGLGVFSCLFVTKDEWVHARTCTGGEHWLHAMLFVSHPLMLLALSQFWPALHASPQTAFSFGEGRFEGIERAFLLAQTGFTVLFGLYQLIYWNFLCKPANTTR
jgi:hypothetical protein